MIRFTMLDNDGLIIADMEMLSERIINHIDTILNSTFPCLGVRTEDVIKFHYPVDMLRFLSEITCHHNIVLV